MLKRLLLFSSVFCLAAAVFAAPPKKYTAEELKWLKEGLGTGTVIGKLEQFAGEFSEPKDGLPLSTATGRIYLRLAKRYQNYYFFEHDTKLDARWLASAIKYMEALVNARHQMNILEGENKKDTPEYKKWADYYQKTAAGLLQGVKKPGKVTDVEKLKALGKEKQQVLEAIEKAGQQRQQPRRPGGQPQPQPQPQPRQR